MVLFLPPLLEIKVPFLLPPAGGARDTVGSAALLVMVAALLVVETAASWEEKCQNFERISRSPITHVTAIRLVGGSVRAERGESDGEENKSSLRKHLDSKY